MSVLLQFCIGSIFGLGLLISGMSEPAKVLSFLDVATMRSGTWDPSLAFVMLGAVATAFIGFRLVARRSKPIFHETFHLPTKRELDPQIFVGPALFGVGWGLVGLCPGPAFVSLGYGSPASILFTIAMLGGMAFARLLANSSAAPQATVPSSG